MKSIRKPSTSLLVITSLILAVIAMGLRFSVSIAGTDEIIASTGFEEAATGAMYYDTSDPTQDHPLANNPGQMSVNFTGSAAEMGYSAYYYNTRDGDGLTDGDYVGVTSYTGDFSAYPQGEQGYEMTDTDGAVRLTFETVSLSGYPTAYLGIDYFVIPDSYETSPQDYIRIWVVVDGGTELDLLDTRGSDIDDLGIESRWETLAIDLSDYTQATLHVELDSNGATEGLYFDHIRFSTTPIIPITPVACTTIMEIQGNGSTSPCVGRIVEDITGCITGVAANGFFMQDSSGDSDPATSDGIYAYFYAAWDNSEGLAPGQLVAVSGAVDEYYSTTEITHRPSAGAPLIVTQLGTCGLPAAVPITPQTSTSTNPNSLYEAYESMRAAMTIDGWVVGATKRFASRFEHDDLELAYVDFSSNIPDYARVFENDYTGYQGINFLSGALDADLPDLDFGDRIQASGLTGIINYQFGKWTLSPDIDPLSALTITDRADVQDDEPALDANQSEFDVCFFNVENLFDPIDDQQGDWGDWAPGYPDPDSSAGWDAYQSKLDGLAGYIINTMQGCMLIGVEEVEGKQAVYDDLAAAVSTLDGTNTWAGVYVESGDPRDISQGFLYREDVELLGSLTPVSGPTYTTRVDDGTLDFVRTIPHGQFRFFGGTAEEIDIHVYAVHFKSKGYSSGCASYDCSDVREKEAADLTDLLAYHQSRGEYAIGGGDFNDFIESSPIDILDTEPDIYGLFQGIPASDWWTYVYNGESEVLDHIYVTRNLIAPSAWGVKFSPVHGQADFPDRERSSDHDAVRAVFHYPNETADGRTIFLPSIFRSPNPSQ